MCKECHPANADQALIDEYNKEKYNAPPSITGIFMFSLLLLLLLPSADAFENEIITEGITDFTWSFDNPWLDDKESYKEFWSSYVDNFGCEDVTIDVYMELPVITTSKQCVTPPPDCVTEEVYDSKNDSYTTMTVNCTPQPKECFDVKQTVYELYDLEKGDYLIQKDSRVVVKGSRKANTGFQSCDMNFIYNDGIEVYDAKTGGELGISSSPPRAWWNISYTTRKEIECSNMADFTPLIINGSSGFSIEGETNQLVWTYCNGSTYLYYTDNETWAVGTDTIQLPHEVERGFNENHNPINVWNAEENAKYVVVYHMNDNSTTTLNDSTGTYNSIKKATNGPIERTGVQCAIGDCQYYDADDFSVIGNDILNGYTNLTLEFYANLSLFDTDVYFLASTWTAPYPIYVVQDSAAEQLLRVDQGTVVDSTVPFFVVNTFAHYVISKNHTSWNIYKNGVFIETFTDDEDAINVSTGNVYRIGCRGASTCGARTTIDEWRLHNHTKYGGYANQSYQNKLGTVGYGSLSSVETSATPLTDTFFGLFNETWHNVSLLIDEGEEFNFWANFSYEDNGTSVYPNGWCNYSAAEVIDEDYHSSADFTVCESGCDSTNYTFNFTGLHEVGYIQDIIRLRLCRLTQATNNFFYVSTNTSAAYTYDYNQTPYCTDGYLNFTIDDANSSGSDVELSVWSDGATLSEGLRLKDGFGGIDRLHNATNVNMTWNDSFASIYVLDYDSDSIAGDAGYWDSNVELSDDNNTGTVITFTGGIGDFSPVYWNWTLLGTPTEINFSYYDGGNWVSKDASGCINGNSFQLRGIGARTFVSTSLTYHCINSIGGEVALDIDDDAKIYEVQIEYNYDQGLFVDSWHKYYDHGSHLIYIDCQSNISGIENQTGSYINVTVVNIPPTISIDNIWDPISGFSTFVNDISKKYPLSGSETINVTGGCSDNDLFNAGVNLTYENGTLIYSTSWLASDNQVPTSVNFTRSNFSTQTTYLSGALKYVFGGYCNDTSGNISSATRSFTARNIAPTISWTNSSPQFIGVIPAVLNWTCVDPEGETGATTYLWINNSNMSNPNGTTTGTGHIFNLSQGTYNLSIICGDTFFNSTQDDMIISYTEDCILNFTGLLFGERYPSLDHIIGIDCINSITISSCFYSINNYADVTPSNCSSFNVTLERGRNRFVVGVNGVEISSFNVWAMDADSNVFDFVVIWIVLGLMIVCFVLNAVTGLGVIGIFGGFMGVFLGYEILAINAVLGWTCMVTLPLLGVVLALTLNR